MVWSGTEWYVLVRNGMGLYDVVRGGTEGHGVVRVVRCGTGWHGMVRSSTG